MTIQELQFAPMMVNGVLSSVILYFLYRLVKRADKQSDDTSKLFSHVAIKDNEHKTNIQLLTRDIEQAAKNGQSLNEIHQAIGVLKRDLVSCFRRVDENKVAQEKNTDELVRLKEKFFELKGRQDA